MASGEAASIFIYTVSAFKYNLINEKDLFLYLTENSISTLINMNTEFQYVIAIPTYFAGISKLILAL